MAEQPDADAHWSYGAAGCGTYVLALGALFLAVGMYSASRFDPEDACADQETGHCLAVESGVVESAGGFFDDVTVVYDDGRQRATVTIAGDEEPAVGSRLRLEWWDDKIVALYDPRHERRYKTTAWPERWDNAGLGFLLLGVPFFFPLLVVRLVRLVRAARV